MKLFSNLSSRDPKLLPRHRGGRRGGATHRAACGGFRGRCHRNAAGFRSADAQKNRRRAWIVRDGESRNLSGKKKL